MKIVYIILACSLALNAGFLVTKGREPAVGAPVVKVVNARSSVVELPKSSSVPQEARLSDAAVAVFSGNNAEALRDLLRDSGLPEEIIRDMVKMRILKNYEKQMKAITEASGHAQVKQAWWKDTQESTQFSLLKEEQDKAERLGREASEEYKRLLGFDMDENQYAGQELSFLSPDKVRALSIIEKDYGDLINKMMEDTNGFEFESASEEMKLIEAEKKRDIKALLSPDELYQFELRQSSTAQNLRSLMTQLDATEAEYLKIFPLQKAFDDKYADTEKQFLSGDRASKFFEEREAAQARLQEKIKSIVGEQRYKESFLKQDPEWRLLDTVTRRLKLPGDTPTQLFKLKETTLEAAQKIGENPKLTPEQKKQSLTALVNSTRSQVSTVLGAEGTDVYLKNNGAYWLESLEKGSP